jgi:thiamine biosynthesis lipoprotein
VSIASTSFAALGTTATVCVAEPASLPDARFAVDGEVAAIDATCSRFREDSELARVNAAGGERVHVSGLFAEALQVALAAAESTDGLVDPTLGRSLRLLGYDRTFRLVRLRGGEDFAARAERGGRWREVELDRETCSVRIPASVELDLGATAKAFAADRAARAAALATGCGVLVSLGGDVAVEGPAPHGGWPVGVADDHAGEASTVVLVTKGGLATSSITVRRWRAGDAELHHVLDPRTGVPAETPWRTATVAATTCVDANVASTAAIVAGFDAPDWLADRSLPARLVSLDGASTCVAGWPEDAA